VTARALRTLAGLACFSAGLALALVPLRPTPWASVAAHARVLLRWWLPGLGLTIFGIAIIDRRRVALGAVGALVLAYVLLAHPVCDPIPPDELPAFETVMPIAARAAAGEPFREFDGRWYQCKSYIARAFFF
jgi:hypothetical protein